MKKKLIIALFFLALCFKLGAQENWPTYVSPRYFGPNAFPVPDMLTRTADKLELELSATAAFGYLAATMDKTAMVNFALRLPLWTERVNFSVWGQMWEWYYDTPEAREIRKVDKEESLSGNLFGDVYFSVDAKILREKEKCPCIILRAACKTATGNGVAAKRYYDAPGYFFDASITKTFRLCEKQSVKIAATSGFLCWQVKANRQNDAVMYGASLNWVYEGFADLSAEYGGYVGWRHDGDAPMTLKVKADFLPGRMFSPFIRYRHGFVDWPYDAVELGLRMSFDLKF